MKPYKYVAILNFTLFANLFELLAQELQTINSDCLTIAWGKIFVIIGMVKVGIPISWDCFFI